MLFELITAANFLKIRKLSAITAKKIASLIRGKSAEEIRNFIGFENEMEYDEIV